MAIVSDNDLTLGLRGRVGKYLVFRSVGGRTIASHSPRRPDPRKQSAAQRKTRATFREAAAWAVQTLRDPEQRRYFNQRARDNGLPNAYTAAVQHRMRWSGGLNDDRVSIKIPVTAEEPALTSPVRSRKTKVAKDFSFCVHSMKTLRVPEATRRGALHRWTPTRNLALSWNTGGQFKYQNLRNRPCTILTGLDVEYVHRGLRGEAMFPARIDPP